MDIKQLEVFVAVAKHKSFSKAAKELFLTQPTVSSHIQNLENEMQSVLLNRHNKTITLTDSGQILYNHAIVILNDCKKAIYDIKQYSGKIAGNINIVCSSVPETNIFPAFLKDFCDKYPNITFAINHCNSNMVIPEITSERMTFAIVGSQQINHQIVSYGFKSDELVLLCPKDIQIENVDGYIEPDEVKNLVLIMRKEGSGTRKTLVSALKKKKIYESHLKIRAYVDSNTAMLEMVKNGLGCAFSSYLSAKHMINAGDVKYYRLQGISMDRNFYLMYSKRKIFTPTEKKFLEHFNKFYEIDIKIQDEA